MRARSFRWLVAAFACAALTGARADTEFTGPGWYQVADTEAGPFLLDGPFPSRDACEDELPANEPDADYSCEYFSEPPGWD